MNWDAQWQCYHWKRLQVENGHMVASPNYDENQRIVGTLSRIYIAQDHLGLSIIPPPPQKRDLPLYCTFHSKFNSTVLERSVLWEFYLFLYDKDRSVTVVCTRRLYNYYIAFQYSFPTCSVPQEFVYSLLPPVTTFSFSDRPSPALHTKHMPIWSYSVIGF